MTPKVPAFHERFNIDVDLKSVRESFVNRILNLISTLMSELETFSRKDRDRQVMAYVASVLGRRYDSNDYFSEYVGDDFIQLLHSLEALYEALEIFNEERQETLEALIISAMSMSEVDLGVEWQDGIFKKSGAKLLDEQLVNEPLQWLSVPEYDSVLQPFKKGLSQYLEADNKPERLADTVTDMYEAVEALAKIVTGRPTRDLSANAELCISKLKLSDYYKKMLKDYIEYANEYRHAIEPRVERKPPLRNEVEAFVYTTGLFIRLAIQQLATP